MGMRHLLVIDPMNRGALVGIITRHELEEGHMDSAEIQRHDRGRGFWTLRAPPEQSPNARGGFRFLNMRRPRAVPNGRNGGFQPLRQVEEGNGAPAH
jgi:hypothetical protein